MHGGYSAYADPIARRAIAASSDEQHDNSSHPNHPIHPSRLQSNIQRRIRDPSQRNEIIAHYNSDARFSMEHKRGWEHAVQNSLPNAPPTFEAYVSSRVQRFSPQPLPALPHAQPCRDIFTQPLENNMQWDRSHDSYTNEALYDITLQTNNNSGRRNVWNESSNAGIPQFRYNRKVTPNLSPPMKSFYAPSSGDERLLPCGRHHSPTQSQILPFDNFNSPFDEQNSNFHNFGSMHDDLNVDVDFFHNLGIPSEKSNPLTFEEPSQRHSNISNQCVHPFGEYKYRTFQPHKIHQSHDPSSMAPSSYQAIQESTDSFTEVPMSNYLSVHFGVPTVQNSEHSFAAESNNFAPPYRDHHIPRHDTTSHPEVMNISDRIQNHQEKPVSMINNGRDYSANTDISLTVSANASTEMGTTSSGLLPESRFAMSSSPDHIEYPIVRHPQPFTVQNQIRFFNEGLEVDISNRPLSRQNCTPSSIEKINQVDMAFSLQNNDNDSNDDFDLVGKTSLWGEK